MCFILYSVLKCQKTWLCEYDCQKDKDASKLYPKERLISYDVINKNKLTNRYYSMFLFLVPMEQSIPDVPKPVFEERFEPKRTPAARSAPEEPSPKARKLQLPSDFVKRTESPREVSPRDQRYRDEVALEIGRKPDLPVYEQTFKLPVGEPAQVTQKHKPRFTEVHC